MRLITQFVTFLALTLWNGEEIAAQIPPNIWEQIKANVTALNKLLSEPDMHDAEQCYDNVGCFYRRKGKSYMAGFPPHPSKQPTDFWLFTKPNQTDFEKLYYNNPGSINASSYDPNCATKFIIHGFSHNGNVTWVKNATQALLKVETCVNVIVVNWENASVYNYVEASILADLIGRQIAILCYHMKQYGAKVSDIHLIGNSLGGQICAFAGQFFRDKYGEKLGRISGLDPAGALFCKLFPFLVSGYYLNRDHALFVDILHTDDIDFGCSLNVGHVDFYANGGSLQPSCIEEKDDAFCSHEMSQDYYVRSIYENSCHFHSFPANGQTYDDFLEGKAYDCSKGCGCMGYRSIDCPGRGKQYLLTLDEYPFYGSHFKLNTSGIINEQRVVLSDGTNCTSSMNISKLVEDSAIVLISKYVILDLTKNITTTTDSPAKKLQLIGVSPVTVTNETGYTTKIDT